MCLLYALVADTRNEGDRVLTLTHTHIYTYILLNKLEKFQYESVEHFFCGQYLRQGFQV